MTKHLIEIETLDCGEGIEMVVSDEDFIRNEEVFQSADLDAAHQALVAAGEPKVVISQSADLRCQLEEVASRMMEAQSPRDSTSEPGESSTTDSVEEGPIQVQVAEKVAEKEEKPRSVQNQTSGVDSMEGNLNDLGVDKPHVAKLVECLEEARAPQKTLKKRVENFLGIELITDYKKPVKEPTLSKKCCNPDQTEQFQLHVSECITACLARTQARGYLETNQCLVELTREKDKSKSDKLIAQVAEGNEVLRRWLRDALEASKWYYDQVKDKFSRFVNPAEFCSPAKCFGEGTADLAETLSWALMTGARPQDLTLSMMAELHGVWKENGRESYQFLKLAQEMEQRKVESDEPPLLDCRRNTFHSTCQSQNLRKAVSGLQREMANHNEELEKGLRSLTYLSIQQESFLASVRFAWRQCLGRIRYLDDCLRRRRVLLDVFSAEYTCVSGPCEGKADNEVELKFHQRGILSKNEIASRLKSHRRIRERPDADEVSEIVILPEKKKAQAKLVAAVSTSNRFKPLTEEERSNAGGASGRPLEKRVSGREAKPGPPVSVSQLSPPTSSAKAGDTYNKRRQKGQGHVSRQSEQGRYKEGAADQGHRSQEAPRRHLQDERNHQNKIRKRDRNQDRSGSR